MVLYVAGRKSIKIKVQQDNAGPHVKDDNTDVMEAGQHGGWDIQMVSQPPRSPDLDCFGPRVLPFTAILAVQDPHV
jgi:hypothetical protein